MYFGRYFPGREVRDASLEGENCSLFHFVTEKNMASNGVGSTTTHEKRRVSLVRLLIPLLVALILSVIIVLVFFSSAAVSR